ncbi:MAG TPA: ABC transporter transmembrane domain-containing protein, partial [Kribbella sp.]
MSGMMRPGMGAMGWRRQDTSVLEQKLAKGTLRRIVRFAKPYRWHITAFLLLVIVSAFLVIASPLLFKKIVDDGISKGNAGLVTALALIVALLAVVEAVLGLVQRWFSARIGEGLIFDL